MEIKATKSSVGALVGFQTEAHECLVKNFWSLARTRNKMCSMRPASGPRVHGYDKRAHRASPQVLLVPICRFHARPRFSMRRVQPGLSSRTRRCLRIQVFSLPFYETRCTKRPRGLMSFSVNKRKVGNVDIMDMSGELTIEEPALLLREQSAGLSPMAISNSSSI